MEVPQASVDLKAFACPHCGAHADQMWLALGAFRMRDQRVPRFVDPATVAAIEKKLEKSNPQTRSEEDAVKGLRRALHYGQGSLSGEPFLYSEEYGNSVDHHLGNVFASRCHTCERIALWVHKRLIYPSGRMGAAPHADLSDDIRRDFEEARAILGISPRGAAALLRLCVQKLCIELGEKGRKIDDDIASLVSKGMDEMVQQGLDAVRVIGNEAVHPGQMDLRDDQATALQLLDLVNDIAAQTIARKKRAAAIYAMLPETKRQAIDARDKKGTIGPEMAPPPTGPQTPTQ